MTLNDLNQKSRSFILVSIDFSYTASYVIVTFAPFSHNTPTLQTDDDDDRHNTVA